MLCIPIAIHGQGSVILLLTAALFVAFAVPLFMGKGTWMIAGINMMSEEERSKLDIPKISKSVGIICLFTAVFLIFIYLFLY
ncbi:MAG: DUF3784 domain-containing protein [Methanomassiliicoccaceae archaeon]|nr:DUF3784 domain-containing protein [Methanomassiliicoccaceae archaeon]